MDFPRFSGQLVKYQSTSFDAAGLFSSILYRFRILKGHMGIHISNKYTLVVVSEYHNDHLGTPLALTDKAGAVVAEWKRDPFGMVASKTGSVDDNNMFPGQFWDSDAGLAYNWNRWYSPEVGRYVQPDPIGINGGSISLYRYARDNPLLWIDPAGLANCSLIGSLDLGTSESLINSDVQQGKWNLVQNQPISIFCWCIYSRTVTQKDTFARKGRELQTFWCECPKPGYITTNIVEKDYGTTTRTSTSTEQTSRAGVKYNSHNPRAGDPDIESGNACLCPQLN